MTSLLSGRSDLSNFYSKLFMFASFVVFKQIKYFPSHITLSSGIQIVKYSKKFSHGTCPPLFLYKWIQKWDDKWVVFVWSVGHMDPYNELNKFLFGPWASSIGS